MKKTVGEAEKDLRKAFDRLKANNPINVPKGTKVSQNNVAREAGKHPTALKKDRYPLLVLEIQDYLKQQEIDKDVLEKKKQMRKQRTLKQQLADCKKQRDRLSSICEAQYQYIEQLQHDIPELKKNQEV